MRSSLNDFEQNVRCTISSWLWEKLCKTRKFLEVDFRILLPYAISFPVATLEFYGFYWSFARYIAHWLHGIHLVTVTVHLVCLTRKIPKVTPCGCTTVRGLGWNSNPYYDHKTRKQRSAPVTTTWHEQKTTLNLKTTFRWEKASAAYSTAADLLSWLLLSTPFVSSSLLTYYNFGCRASTMLWGPVANIFLAVALIVPVSRKPWGCYQQLSSLLIHSAMKYQQRKQTKKSFMVISIIYLTH